MTKSMETCKYQQIFLLKCPFDVFHSVAANVLECDIKTNGFELPSPYNVPFHTNTLEKGMDLLTPPGMS